MRLYGEKNPSVTSKSLRYYDLPRKVDDWEIERNFVSIDYMKILGKGAFGSVFVGMKFYINILQNFIVFLCKNLGRILAKNIPPAIERSIIELSALQANNDTVAVKLLNDLNDHKDKYYIQ